MIILFISIALLLTLFLVAFFAFLNEGDMDAFLFLIPAVILVLMSIYVPIQRTEEFPINKPEIVFNSNGAIIAFEKSNYIFKDFAEVECLKNGTMVPVNQKKYNFYNCLAYSEVVLKPLDETTKIN